MNPTAAGTVGSNNAATAPSMRLEDGARAARDSAGATRGLRTGGRRRAATPARRSVSAAALVVLAALLALAAFGAQAQVFQAFSQRYQTVANGDLFLLSNTSMTCSAPSNGSCPAVANKNDGLSMVNSKLPEDAADATIFNSSRADLTSAQLPAGAQVLKAQLYWGGLVVDAGGAPSPNPSISAVRLARPGGGYQTVMPAGCVVSPTSTIWGGSAHHVYQCYADVTATLQSGSGTYRVANVPVQSGATNRFGGWSIAVVVRNPARPLRDFTINDGLAAIATTGTNPVNQVSLTVSGFRTSSSGPVAAQLGWLAFDGDVGAADGFTFQGQGSPTLSLGDACNPAGDVFNSTTCALATPISSRSVANGNGANTLGFDADIVQLPNPGNANLRNGATSATLTARTSSEGYTVTMLTTAIDVFQPAIDAAAAKSQTNLTHPALPAGQALPGDQIRYTIVLGNVGQDNAENVTIRDAVPTGTDYVPGSLQVIAGAAAGPRSDAAGDDTAEFATGSIVFRVGAGASATQGGTLRCTACAGTQDTGATIAFVVKVRDDAAAGGVIRNTGQVTFTGVSSQQSFTEATNETVLRILAAPKLTLAKIISGRALATDQFTLNIDNGGPTATSAAAATTLTTTAFVATAGTTYTLSEIGAGTPAANLANYLTTYSCVNGEGGSTDVPAGSATSFQVTPANGDDLVCTFTNVPRRSDLAIAKTNQSTSLLSGASTTYTITVTNNGPDPVSGALLKDPATPNLSCQSPATCTGAGCPTSTLPLTALQGGGVTMGAMAKGESAVVSLTCDVK
jgi:uncharacterized repeat protein (TIGR01451 family)